MIHRQTYAFTVTDPATGQDRTHTHTVATEVEPLREYPVEFRRCRRHRHRTDAAEASCLWRYAEWVAGRGRWATLAGCGVLTVVLHATKAEALASLAFIDTYGCGHRCPNRVDRKRHRLVHLTAKASAGPPPAPEPRPPESAKTPRPRSGSG